MERYIPITKRVIRALEFYKETGQRISDHNEAERQKSPRTISSILLLTKPRAFMKKIDRRVDFMMEEGLLDEVSYQRPWGPRQNPSMQGLGYKEMLDYLDGITTH